MHGKAQTRLWNLSGSSAAVFGHWCKDIQNEVSNLFHFLKCIYPQVKKKVYADARQNVNVIVLKNKQKSVILVLEKKLSIQNDL